MLILAAAAAGLQLPVTAARRSSIFCCAPSDTATDAEVDDGKSAALVADLRLSAARAERGFRVDGALEELRQKVEAVEAANPEPEPVDSPLLLGEWDLEFTDAFDVLSLGLSPLEVGRISQNVRAGASAGELQAENIVELLPPLSSLAAAASLQLPRAATEYCVGATCRRLSGRRVSLVFSKLRVRPWLPFVPWGLPDGVRLEAALPSAAVDALESLTSSAVYLETTYLDEGLRVARGPGGEIYVLARRR